MEKAAKVEKITITQEDFNKRVEIEFAYLTHIDRLPKFAAEQNAYKTVSEKYQVARQDSYKY